MQSRLGVFMNLLDKTHLKKTLIIISSLLTDPSFINRIISSNYEVIKDEYPEANLEIVLEGTSIDELAISGEEWKRAVAGIIYANAALGTIQLYREELHDRESYILASMYFWSRSAEVFASTSSKGLFLIPQLLIDISNTYENAESLVVPFVIGTLQKIRNFDERKAIGLAINIVVECYRKAALLPGALEIIYWIRKEAAEKLSSELLGILLKIERDILSLSGKFKEATLVTDKLIEMERDPLNVLKLMIEKSECLFLQEEFEEAIRVIDCVQTHQSYSSLSEEEKLQATLIKANSLLSLRRYEESLGYFDQAELLADKLKLTKTRLETITNKSTVLIEIGRYDEAIRILEPALEKLEIGDTNNQNLLRLRAKMLYNLGLGYASMGYQEKGLKFLEEAYSILSSLRLDDDKTLHEIAILLARIAVVKINLGNLSEATIILHNAKELAEKIQSQTKRKKLRMLLEYLDNILADMKR